MSIFALHNLLRTCAMARGTCYKLTLLLCTTCYKDVLWLGNMFTNWVVLLSTTCCKHVLWLDDYEYILNVTNWFFYDLQTCNIAQYFAISFFKCYNCTLFCVAYLVINKWIGSQNMNSFKMLQTSYFCFARLVANMHNRFGT